MKSITLTSLLLGAVICMSSTLSFAEKQPRMQGALKHLEKAQMQLKKDSRDKGGIESKL